MSYFGETNTVGSVPKEDVNLRFVGSVANLSYKAKIDHIAVFIHIPILDTRIRCMIYDNGYNLVGCTEIRNTHENNPLGGWHHLYFLDSANYNPADPESSTDASTTNKPTLEAGNYYLALHGASGPAEVQVFYQIGGAMDGVEGPSVSFPTPPNPLIPTAWDTALYNICGYAMPFQDASENLKCKFVVGAGGGLINGSEDLHGDFYLPSAEYSWAELKATFYVKLYRGPENIDADTYGAVLVLDPRGIRQTDPKGPLYLLLDMVVITPGLTEKGGAFYAEINDNGHPDPTSHPDSYYPLEYVYDRHLPLWIFRDETDWVRDKDEFWVGVQRGPGNDPYDPEPAALTWDPTGGGDGKGAGRKWLFGGFIVSRYWNIERDRRITAVIEGVGHMDIWRDQLFGTPSIPRDYTVITDTAIIAEDVIDDIVQQVAPPADYPDLFPFYSKHPTVFPVSTGVNWLREFKQDSASEVMTEIADEGELVGAEKHAYEWRIDYLRRVHLYRRGDDPLGVLTAPDINLDNIREVPKLLMGDSSEQITHVIATDAAAVTSPSDIDLWCMPGLWPDLTNPNRDYHGSSIPPPPNPKTGDYVDSSLVFDDEGHPAVCHLLDFPYATDPPSSGQYNIHLSPFGTFAQLALDLRVWRILKFRFRHVTRNGSADSEYLVRIHTTLQAHYTYDFSSLITDDNFTEIKLDLPQLDENGSVINLNNWTPNDEANLDPTHINWVSLDLDCKEDPKMNPTIGSSPFLGKDIKLASAYTPAADKDSCELTGDVGKLGGLTAGLSNEFFWPIYVIFDPTGNKEPAKIEAVYPAGCTSPLPGTNNVRLSRELDNSYLITDYVRIRMGWAISFSQLHFERNIRVEGAADDIYPPFRYRMDISKDIETLQEATLKADATIAQEALARQFIRTAINGDPRFEIGFRTKVNLGFNPFYLTYMIIDDIEYRLDASNDFEIEVLLGQTDARARELDEISAMETHDKQIRNLGLGKHVLR